MDWLSCRTLDGTVATVLAAAEKPVPAGISRYRIHILASSHRASTLEVPPPLEGSEIPSEPQLRKPDNPVELGSHTAATHVLRSGSLLRGYATMESPAGGVPSRWLVKVDRVLSA